MFMGTYYNSIDAKNRMIVPSKHRDQLGGKCVITKGFGQMSIHLFTAGLGKTAGKDCSTAGV